MHLLLLFASATVLSALQAAFFCLEIPGSPRQERFLCNSVQLSSHQYCVLHRSYPCCGASVRRKSHATFSGERRFPGGRICALRILCPQEDLSARINELRSERKREGAWPKHRGFYSHNDANGMLLPNLPAAIVTALACSDAEHHATHVANALALGTCLKRQQAALPAIIGLEITQRMSAPSRACSVSLLLW